MKILVPHYDHDLPRCAGCGARIVNYRFGPGITEQAHIRCSRCRAIRLPSGPGMWLDNEVYGDHSNEVVEEEYDAPID